MDEKEKNRGGCLSGWLVFTFITSFLATIFGMGLASLSLYGNLEIRRSLVGMSDTLLAYAIISYIALICVIGMINWKRWGFYGYILCTVAMGAIAHSLGLPLSRVLLSSSGIIVLGALILERW